MVLGLEAPHQPVLEVLDMSGEEGNLLVFSLALPYQSENLAD